MYWPYQKPKRCWKCGGNKTWIPYTNKWVCPRCEPKKAYPQQLYPQYGYPQTKIPTYRGPPPPTPSYTYPPYQRPLYLAVSPIHHQTYPIQNILFPAGTKRCNYCGATMNEDEEICPKCMQRALIL